MGRYYNGDIEGKFWFGIQSSDDASFFGAEPYEPNYMNYHFNKEEHLDSVITGVKKCIDTLGKNKKILDKFFKDNNGYNEEMIVKQTNIPMKKIPHLLEWYARLRLGNNILKCLKEQEECNFEAEC